MKKIICQLSVSLDGYFEGPNRELDWHLFDDELKAFVIETLAAAEVLIMGGRNYELMAGYWPTAVDDDPIKGYMNGTPKLVFSRRLKEVRWENSRLATRPIEEEVAALRRAPGDGLLWVGASGLAAEFLDRSLLDELRVVFTPVLLGAGHSLLAGITRRHPLKLASTRSFGSGVIVATYVPAARG